MAILILGRWPRLGLRSAFGADTDEARMRQLHAAYLRVRNPVSGLVADAAFSFSANPISRASRPASMAFLNAFAIRTGSEAIAIAVLTSTASAPISIASAACRRDATAGPP